MFHEAIQDLDKAKEIYNELIQINPTDFQSLKRLVALERDRGKINEAIGLLNKYIENNQQDHEAWLELTELYLSKHNYDKAMFCYEEILAINPGNYHVNIRYAEILYSAGSDNIDNLYTARKYYSHALTLQNDKTATRALWGLLKVCKAIESNLKKEDEKNTELIKVCQEKINEIYASKKTSANVQSMTLMK